MKLLVTGGRNYDNAKRVHAALTALHARRPITILIHGAAVGVDRFAEQWARANRVQTWPFPIKSREWELYEGLAGRRRNQRMLDASKPDFVLAFPGRSGTADMLERARKAGIEALVIPREK